MVCGGIRDWLCRAQREMVWGPAQICWLLRAGGAKQCLGSHPQLSSTIETIPVMEDRKDSAGCLQGPLYLFLGGGLWFGRVAQSGRLEPPNPSRHPISQGATRSTANWGGGGRALWSP